MYSLVVEDDLVSRKVLQRGLAKHGECDTAPDGQAALDAYLLAKKNEHPYELICLDIMLPVLSGIQVLEAIRKDEKQQGLEPASRVKIIMTTGMDDESNITGSFSEGCEGYLTKPIDMKQLSMTLRELQLIG